MLFDVMRSINSMNLILGKSWKILKMFNGVNIMLILFLYLCFIIVNFFGVVVNVFLILRDWNKNRIIINIWLKE